MFPMIVISLIYGWFFMLQNIKLQIPCNVIANTIFNFFFVLLFCHFNTPLIEDILLQLLRSVCMFADPQLQKHKHAHTALHIWTVIQMVLENGL